MDNSVSDAALRDDDALAGLEAEAAASEGAAGPAPTGGEYLPAEAEPDTQTADMLHGLLVPAFAILAPAWAVQESECRALADAWAPIAEQYLPDDGGAGSPWIAAAVTTLAVIGPRYGTPRHPPTDEAAKDSEAHEEPAKKRGEHARGDFDGTTDLTK